MTALVALAVALAAQQSTPPPTSPSKPLGSFDDSSSNQSRSLQSVGIRGTIDAGGYAASATLKTQTEFFEQLVTLQVAVLRPVWGPQDSCVESNALRHTAVVCLARGEYSAAVSALEALLHSNSYPETHQLLGLAYEGTGQLDAAAAQFSTAVAAAPGNVSGIVAYSVALLLQGEVDHAVAVSRQASAQGGDPLAIARLSLGAALFQDGNTAEALRLFLDAATAQSSQDAPFDFIAIAVRSADPATLIQLIARLKSLARKSPNNGTAHYALACALMAAAGGSPDLSQPGSEIESELKQAVTLAPHLPDAHFRLAAIYAAREELPLAIAEYRSALDGNPRLLEAHYRLSQLFMRCGQPQLAREQLELHQQLRAKQKSEIESGKVPVNLPESEVARCP